MADSYQNNLVRLLGQRGFLILDRDTKFTDQFKRTLKCAGVASVLISYQAPNMNAVAEAG